MENVLNCLNIYLIDSIIKRDEATIPEFKAQYTKDVEDCKKAIEDVKALIKGEK
jgi:hypothetical protein